MTKRYSIIGRQSGSNNDIELAQCETNPAAVLEAFKAKSLTIASGDHKRVAVSKYVWLKIVDNEA